MKLADRRTDIESLEYVIKAYEASTQSKNLINKLKKNNLIC